MLFLDLPIEILPEILKYVLKPSHLASLCLVNRTFQPFATARLYEKIYIYSWHKEGKLKVVKLFDTLSRYVYLANHLHRLGAYLFLHAYTPVWTVAHSEIRDFPKAVTTIDSDILNHVLRGLRNCTNLQSCTWTRDGSLNSDVFEALQHCPRLRDLEFNGHNDGHYDPKILLGFTNLQRILIIMPSLPVVSQLRPWLALTGHSLRSFALICKGSTFITDALLEGLAPQLPNLEHFHLTGCPKVTDQGVWAIASSTSHGLLGLNLEGVSPKFDMAHFAIRCTSSGTLSNLRSITLTVHQQISIKEWIAGVMVLLSASPLERFQIYSTGASFESSVTEDLWKNLVFNHGRRLIRISVHRMLISLDAIGNICSQCPNLEELFVVMESHSFNKLADCLSLAKNLRTVHINSPIEASMHLFPFVLRADQALSIIRRCHSTLTQFGCNAKVWQVDRRIIKDEDGTLRAERILGPYGSPEIPEQFTVVRT